MHVGPVRLSYCMSVTSTLHSGQRNGKGVCSACSLRRRARARARTRSQRPMAALFEEHVAGPATCFAVHHTMLARAEARCFDRWRGDASRIPASVSLPDNSVQSMVCTVPRQMGHGNGLSGRPFGFAFAISLRVHLVHTQR
jgi:hypothetical protein